VISSSGAIAKETGSSGLTSNSRLTVQPANAAAAARPTASPAAAVASASRTTNQRMPRSVAPSAMRMPISALRCPTR